MDHKKEEITILISLRGTNGSGKTTVVRKILDGYPKEEIVNPDTGKIEGYRVSIPFLKKPVMIIGSYKTACGGGDGIQPYSLIWPRIEAYEKEGHVIFEGSLISSSYGNIGRATLPYGNDAVFAFMDTPLEECIRRVQERRLKKGNTKPLNPKNLIGKYKNVERSIRVIRDEWRRRILILDHRKALAQVLGVLKNG